MTTLFAASANNFNIWTRVYTGTETYFDDRGLPRYTTFQYRVTAFNDFGQVTSSPSEEVTTFGGIPTAPPTIDARVVDHVTIEVAWQTPSEYTLFQKCKWARILVRVKNLEVQIVSGGSEVVERKKFLTNEKY